MLAASHFPVVEQRPSQHPPVQLDQPFYTAALSALACKRASLRSWCVARNALASGVPKGIYNLLDARRARRATSEARRRGRHVRIRRECEGRVPARVDVLDVLQRHVVLAEEPAVDHQRPRANDGRHWHQHEEALEQVD
eukprot:6106590-Pleurochrysis_carterae.AAC.1